MSVCFKIKSIRIRGQLRLLVLALDLQINSNLMCRWIAGSSSMASRHAVFSIAILPSHEAGSIATVYLCDYFAGCSMVEGRERTWWHAAQLRSLVHILVVEVYRSKDVGIETFWGEGQRMKMAGDGWGVRLGITAPYKWINFSRGPPLPIRTIVLDVARTKSHLTLNNYWIMK